MTQQTPASGFGKRPVDVAWSTSTGATEIRTSPGRSLLLALVSAVVTVLLVGFLIGLVRELDMALAVGWFAAAPVLFGLVVFVSALCGIVWIGIVALRSLMRTGAVLTVDRKRVIVRTGEGTMVLPWATTRAKLGAFFLSLHARLLKEGDEPVTILVPMFLLKGGARAVQEAVESVGAGRAERSAFRSGPARNGAG